MNLCFECGGCAEARHHVVPKSRGGTKTVDLCGQCHAKSHNRKGNMDARTLTKHALAAKRSKGERVGQIPFGWTNDNGRLVAVPAEQIVLVRIHECRQAGLSLRAIAAILMAEGITTKEGRTVWFASSIKSILDRAKTS